MRPGGRARAGRLPRGATLLAEAGALSSLLALRGLREAVEGVRAALVADDIGGARVRAARDLVSRDTAALDASELSGAAIQSLAENLSDSVVAPLLAYAAGGLPAAAAYRALNTADAMWGYRTPELLHHGRAAARADDAANLIPSRLTALLIAARAPQRREALRVALRDHGLAPSPNGGWPMAAMAGGLGVRLVKRGSYAFNAEAPAPPQTTSAVRSESSVGSALMVQGCTSHAGKSYLAAALCRLLAERRPARRAVQGAEHEQQRRRDGRRPRARAGADRAGRGRAHRARRRA